MMIRRGPAMVMKRGVDIVGAAVAMVLLAPVYVTVSAVVLRALGRPVLFTQHRPGRGGEIFTIWKFRTLTNDTGDDGEMLDDGERLTPFGSAIRRWSLDELPELWNVLKGDMSLVGPRPLLVDYLGLYTEKEMLRHSMRPGLTGLAQVSGRNDQSWEDRLALDVWYVQNWSFQLDVRILAATVVKVLTREGTSAAGHATMPRFEGSRRG